MQVSDRDSGADMQNPLGRQFRMLIALSWVVPPLFGLSFLVWVVELFTLGQLGQMLLTPPLPLFVIGSQVAADLYFKRFWSPIGAFIAAPSAASEELALARARRFPLDFWTLFLAYLVLAPVAVVASAVMAYGLEPRPVDWFRIELVALVVSIVVGLPIFFRVIDLFGMVFRDATLGRAHVKISTKVFLIGALVPLLIDTMLVQYYWTKTGYFTYGTFVVWLGLELLAIAGALMFVRSFRQSLAPLDRAMEFDESTPVQLDDLRSQSTDELGVLAGGYRRLWRDMDAYNRLLTLRNQLLAGSGSGIAQRDLVEAILGASQHAVDADAALLALYEEATDELVVVGHTGRGYSEEGFVRIPRGDRCLAWRAFDGSGVEFVADSGEDGRVNGQVVRGLGYRGGIAAPLRVAGRPVGVLLGVYSSPRAELPPGGETRFHSIALEVSAFLQAAKQREREEGFLEELAHAQRLESVGRLAAGVAHDFNNILTAILASAEMLIMKTDSAEARVIVSSANRAAALTGQLLAMSRKQVLLPKNHEVNMLVRGLQDILQRLLPEGIDLQLDLADDLWKVCVDPTQFEQVLLNLVVNARDAIGDRGRIEIRSAKLEGMGEQRSPTGDWVTLRVCDDGAGMDAATQRRAFEPYFTTKDKHGTGLGLATVSGIVAQSGGHLFVDSTPGEGTTFTVLFPRASRASSPQVEATSVTPSPDGSLTLLLVEDDESARASIAKMLHDEPFTVLAAGSGDEALSLAHNHGGEIHIVLSGAAMPGMGGLELANRLRTVRPTARAILMSGYVDDQTLVAISESGLMLLSKPFGRDALLSRLAATPPKRPVA